LSVKVQLAPRVQALIEELGDVLGNIIVIANKYNIPLEEVFHSHKQKLLDRYSNV